MRRAVFLCLLALLPLSFIAGQPADGQVLFDRGTSLYQRGDFRRAHDAFTESIEAFELRPAANEQGLMNARLWAGAASFQLGRPGEAEAFYVGAFLIADELGDATFGANIATALANLKNSTGEYPEAAEWYLRAAEYFQELGNTTQSRQSTEYAGYVQTLAGMYEDAFAIFNDALVRATEVRGARRPPSEIAWLHAMRGNAHYYLERLSDALADYEAAANLLEPAGRSVELSQYYAWIGKILFDSGENELAPDYFDRSLTMARQTRSREDEARVLAYFGFLHASIGEYDLGAEFYEQSLRIALSLRVTEFIIAAYDSLAWIYEQAEDEARALEATRNLVDAYSRTNDEENLALALNDYGLLLYYAGKYSEATSAYEEALGLQARLGNRRDQAVIMLNLGVALEEAGHTGRAASMVERSLAISLELGELEDAEDSVGFLGYLYGEGNQYEKLITVLERFIPVYEAEGRRTELMHVLNNLGVFHYSMEEYESAIDYYQSARTISHELASARDEAIHLHNIGQAQAALSRFDVSLATFDEALQLASGEDSIGIRGSILNSIGELYRAWGWFERSHSYYREAEALFMSVDDDERLASVYNNMGQAVRQAGDPAGSIDWYQKALDLNTQLDDAESRAVNLSNLGEAQRELGNLSAARELYGRALRIDNESRNLRGISIRKNNIGLILLLNGRPAESVPYFDEALEYWRLIGDLREEAVALENLGDAYFDIGRYSAAAGYLEQAVAIQERLRETASGSVRREFLQNQIFVYRSLARAYLFDGQIWRSLYAMELSKAKYLLEQMGENLADASFDYDTLLEFQNELDSSSALLAVSRLDSISYQVILLNNKEVASRVVLLNFEYIGELYDRYSRQIIRETGDPDDDHLEGLITYYRTLLAKPILSQRDSAAIDEIGNYLYSLSVGPMEEQLEGITSLIIVPDGLLGVVPFETFKGIDDRYLIERFDISYAQSLVVALQSIRRSRPASRQPFLAFGGAVYEAPSVSGGEGDTRGAGPGTIEFGDLDGIRLEVTGLVASGKSTRGAYSRMGLDTWQSLPGTLEEVTSLAGIVEGAVIYTGDEVTEAFVKELSDSGALAGYKVLHFATHGIVVPEVPELSAVVLSQFTEDTGGEDGYLTMREISGLDIAADFVNLSACETGLGKVYQGEGVVGLTQAFLVAGANALSVSLWQVADESTRAFMIGLYSLVENEGLGYAQAMSAMKRSFLQDARYANPFYWAPFVFYGDFGAGR